MTIYKSIFLRKSVRRYRMETLGDSTLESIRLECDNIQGLFPGIRTSVRILDCTKKRVNPAFPRPRAPYYLAVYTQEQDKCMMNVGFLLEQMSLYLCSMGLGSCFVGSERAARSLEPEDGLRYGGMLAFGRPKGSAVRRPSEFKRLDMERLCVCREEPHPWMIRLLEAARLAPSSHNSQPWRFLVHDNKIHIFSRRNGFATSGRIQEMNFGVLFAHFMVTAEEMWLDLDLIRLENISQKSFSNCDYVLSAVLHV